MNTDHEWATGLFERSRDAEEPFWAPDQTTLMRSARRRSRIRTLTASGGMVAAAALVVGVGIGVGGALGRKAPGPGPGSSAAAVDPAEVLGYAAFSNPVVMGSKFVAEDVVKVPASTARDTLQVLTRLDPTLAHFAKAHAVSQKSRVVPDDDPAAEETTSLSAAVLWTVPGTSAADAATRLAGTLSLAVDSAQQAPDAQEHCMTTGAQPPGLLGLMQVEGEWKEIAALGPCTKSTLPDGSTLWSSTTSADSLTVVSVTRYFANNGGVLEVAWRNFPLPTTSPNWAGHAVNPNPITVEQLKAALSDPTLVPPLPPHTSSH